MAHHQAVRLAPVLVQDEEVGEVVGPGGGHQVGDDGAAPVEAGGPGQDEAQLLGELGEAGGGVAGGGDEELREEERGGEGGEEA